MVSLQLAGTASAPLKATVLEPCDAPKLFPVMVTAVPTEPEVGAKLVMAGADAGETVRVAGLLVALPAELLTTTSNVEPSSAVVVAGVV